MLNQRMLNQRILSNNKLSKIGGMVLLLTFGGAQAAMINFTTIGDVIIGQENAPNIFGLSAGDTITANGSFDDSGLIAGTGTVIFDSGHPSNSLMISLGAYTLYGSDDVSYLSGGFPALTFNNYQLTDFGFLNNELSSWGLGFDDTYSMYGEWRSAVEFTPVPLPAALWLLGSGLIGLAGVMRKNQ